MASELLNASAASLGMHDNIVSDPKARDQYWQQQQGSRSESPACFWLKALLPLTPRDNRAEARV